MTRSVAVAVLAAVAAFALGWAVRPLPPPPPPPPPVFGPPGPGAVVARWKGGQLTADQLRAHLAELTRAARLGTTTVEQRKAFADEVLRSEVVADEAVRAGLLADPQVIPLVKQALARRYLEKEFDEGLARQQITDEDLRAYYQAHQAEFVRPEKVHLLDLFVSAPADAKDRVAKRKEAEALRKELASADEAAFLKKARALANDEAAGDLGPLSKDEMQAKVGPEFTQAGWLMVRLGEVSQVIQTPQGFHLARLHARIGALDTPFEAARETLRSRLWYERRAGEIEKFVAQLKSTLGLSVDQAALDKALADPAVAKP